MSNEQLVAKVWNYAHVLRDQGISYGDYIEQITYLLFFDKRPASREVQTRELWVYDYRTNVHKTLKTKRLTHAGFDGFIRCYRERKETERFRRFTYDELAQRDKLNLDIFWLRDDSLKDIDSLPEPDVLPLRSSESFRSVSAELAGEAE